MFWDILKVTIYEHVAKQAEAYLLQKSDIESVFHRRVSTLFSCISETPL